MDTRANAGARGEIAGCLGPPAIYIKGLTYARRFPVKHLM